MELGLQTAVGGGASPPGGCAGHCKASATRRELGRGGSRVSYFRATGAYGLGLLRNRHFTIGGLPVEVSNRSISQPQFPCPSLKGPAEEGKNRPELRCP